MHLKRLTLAPTVRSCQRMCGACPGWAGKSSASRGTRCLLQHRLCVRHQAPAAGEPLPPYSPFSEDTTHRQLDPKLFPRVAAQATRDPSQ